ncbi:Rap1a/Tai family immunity protein [Paracraurococcus lichenis]|uniref:Rap1a/Tai family immunity protein n=1 Tax=Paracraurococcus lichenis TaxID=3064888 RepID=A0ABT9DT02_9PROT|nr:Rap1a/Tai family immunity protein [Paracraurococcus sp. LOR1-02]MDO9707024.1 Rap1a/Tai family immunity protein [Paracraurococcus sp. LOR1-02]
MLLAAFAAVLLAGPAAAEVTEQEFRSGRTGDLAALCGAPVQDPMHTAAVNWCQGFMVGAGQYHRSVAAAHGDAHRVFCLPTPEPTLEQARLAFVAWAAKNPQYAQDRAVDGLTRFAAETWPCPRAESPRRPRR